MDKKIHFYERQYYMLSNFSAHSVDIWGKVFATSEHAYQYKKFETTNTEVAEMIFRARSPHEAKQIAIQYAEYIREDWDDIKVSVMYEVCIAKCNQHRDVQDALRQTEDFDIEEDSPVDYYWGIGKDGSGENHLGRIWMKIRTEQ